MDFIVRASLGMIKNLQSYPRRDGFSSRKMKAVSEGQKVDIYNGARLEVTKFTPASLPENHALCILLISSALDPTSMDQCRH